MATQGIDISSNNPHPIDFAAVKESGRSFVIVKLTEGGGATSYVNPHAAQDIAEAQAAGCLVAGYHFVHPTIPAAQQVSLIEQHLDKVNLVWVDSELPSSSFQAVGTVTKAICQLLAQRVKVGLYSNLYFLENMPGAPWGYPLWLAHYAHSPGHSFTIWQFTSSGGCHGVVGAVDLNLFPGSDADLAKLFGPKV